MSTAYEYWTTGPGTSEVREVAMPEPGEAEVLIATEISGISRGTETLVHRGDVPEAVASLMRAPHQLGELPYPVSHGYLNVGRVLSGPAHLRGQRVFTLAGHRSHVVVPAEDCHVLPEQMPSPRALLAGVAEVGLNAVWEAQLSLGERVAVVGAGLVGLCTALMVSKLSPQRLEVIDIDPQRRQLAEELGLTSRTPADAEGDNDVVIHTSAKSAGLTRSLEITGDDGTVVELSWYGEHEAQAPLGVDFHARRLRILGVQVGEVATAKRLRRTRRERLSTAVSLLDDRFDSLITGSSPLQDLPQVMDDLTNGAAWTRDCVLHTVTYQ
ncbi:zinc-dependent alcohol dehydrogenase [Nesterenkonia alba]|uniref:zinc-dependent alcohol dehydrogenase n=1 Tax=Nesterenkonia alba TaxID=515814 RepID=UPI0003B55E45|nr:zinc-binding alcohol dehydrogenase [Nesterenkonia alba]